MAELEKRLMFAHRCTGSDDNIYYAHFGGSIRFVKLYGLKHPIVEVELEEIPAKVVGCYWGWQDTGKDKWSMIWRSEMQFSMCFLYGYEVSVKAGKGRVVYLTVKEIGEYKDD